MEQSIAELERKLAEVKRKEKDALTHCTTCKGAGFFVDSTYDRSGTDVVCGRCRGTGFPKVRIDKIIADAFAPYKQWTPT